MIAFKSAALSIRGGLLGLLVATLSWSGSTGVAQPPSFNIYTLGLTDGEHTSSDGVQRSGLISSNGIVATSDYTVGRSTQYTNNSRTGDSAWIFERQTGRVSRIGLIGGEYLSPSTGQHRSIVHGVTDSGFAFGVTSTNPASSTGDDHAWVYSGLEGRTVRVGLSADLADSAIDYAQDRVLFMNNDGYASGLSSNRLTTESGRVFVYDPSVGRSVPIGLDDSDITTPSGYEDSTVRAMTDNRHVIGYSERLSAAGGGSALWVYDAAMNTTVRLGINGAEAVSSGVQRTELMSVSPGNLVLGRSESAGSPRQPWVHDLGSGRTAAIPLTRPNGVAGVFFESAVFINDRLVLGSSNDSSINSEYAWIFDPDTNQNTHLGFFDTEHTSPSGRQISDALLADPNGFVVGRSARGTDRPSVARNNNSWHYDHSRGKLTQIGLTEGDYTGVEGGRVSRPIGVNASGQAIGFSRAFGNGNGVGTIRRDSAWFFDPDTGETFEIAKSFADATSINRNRPIYLTNDGLVAGIATDSRQGGGDYAWTYNHVTGEARTATGPRDARHLRGNRSGAGGADIFLDQLTDSGLLLGYSTRYSGSADVGRTAWVYDSNQDELASLVFSMRPSNGSASTTVTHLTEDGQVFGFYDHYDDEQLIGSRPFYWSMEHGFFPLESLVNGGLDTNGWESLTASSSNVLPSFIDEMYVLGVGTRSGGNRQVAFALVPIPEPSSIASLILTSALIAAHRCRACRFS